MNSRCKKMEENGNRLTHHVAFGNKNSPRLFKEGGENFFNRGSDAE